MMRLTRRAALGAGLAALAGGAWGQARPLPRPLPAAPIPLGRPPLRPVPPSLAEAVRAAGLAGRVGVAVVDLDGGDLLDSLDASVPHPPASVAKSVTALWALDALGEDRRFATRVLLDGAVRDGVLDGDLYLAGGGDPTLVTDALATLADALVATGLREVRGRLLAWGGAVPEFPQIAPDQLPHLGYNPAVGGLCLNFNRVFVEWARAGADYRLTLDARGDDNRPEVGVARVLVADREAPVWTYAEEGGVDVWTVARGALGEAGSRWLPVRRPALHAGQAFAALCAARGLSLPPAEEGPAPPPSAREAARLESEPLADIVRDMLRYSTNLTAEVLGLHASLARGPAPASLAQSARRMDEWVEETTGARADLVDHSGLGGASRVAALDLAVMLAARGTADRLRLLLKDIELTGADGEPLPTPPALVRAKTGTLNFVSCLAGYMRTIGGRDLAFAILASDLDQRAEAAGSDEDIPEGAQEWTERARRLQQVLVQRWGATYG